MFFLSKPSEATIRAALAARQTLPFSYSSVGATKTSPPAGRRINHMRLMVGAGRTKFEALVDALFSWKLLAVDGLQLFPRTPTLQPGTDLAILSRHFGIWSLDFCRVIYVLQDQPEQNGRVHRTGFAYGTLPGHAVCGEELFSVEWHAASEEVWYDIYSFSSPATVLLRLIVPIARARQRRFARASVAKAAQLAAQSEK